MDISSVTASIASFSHNYPAIAIALALCLLFFIYRRPKLFLGILLLGVFLGGIYYVITNMASSGSKQKQDLLFQEEKQLE